MAQLIMPNSISSSRFILLDGLRGVAALAVASFHIYFYQIRIFTAIPIAVDFFFVLSGFVLSNSLMNSDKNIKRFIKSRIMRLYPAIFVAFIIILATRYTFLERTTTASHYDLKDYVLAFFLLQAFIWNLYPICIPLWSLSAELFVNIFAAITLNKKKAHFIYLFILMGLFLEIYSETNIVFISDHLFWFLDPNYSGIGRAFVGFGLGVLLYVKNSQRSNARVTRVSNFTALPLIALIFISEYFLVICDVRFIYLAAPIFYFLIQYVIRLDQSLFSSKFLSVCAYLGRLSYGIYVFHMPIHQLFSGIFLAEYLKFNLLEPHFLILGFVLKIFATCLVAEFSLRFVEIPLRRWVSCKNSES
jgi:peptidoglycan/LPS O-acetylase OafA/YrhL